MYYVVNDGIVVASGGTQKEAERKAREHTGRMLTTERKLLSKGGK